MEEFKLENLPYQETAIQSAVKVFDGTEKNTVNNACIECTVLPNCTPPPICSITTSIPNNDESKNSFVLYPNPSN